MGPGDPSTDHAATPVGSGRDDDHPGPSASGGGGGSGGSSATGGGNDGSSATGGGSSALGFEGASGGLASSADALVTKVARNPKSFRPRTAAATECLSSSSLNLRWA